MRRQYERGRWSVFISVTLGYGLYYMCRLSLSVVKAPILKEGFLDAHQMGKIGSALFITYAFGKFTNGFLADRMNVKRFMSLGLLVSALVNLGLGFRPGFALFVVLWGLNGWFQSLGAAPSVVALSQWFSPREIGTRYGVWSASHNIGGALNYIITAAVVSAFGWHWGFISPGIVCALGAILLFAFLKDRPQTYGLPAVADYKNDHVITTSVKKNDVWELQKEVLKNPAVWILGLASACMYITRYAVESWGILFLSTHKGYSMMESSSIISASPLLGILGTISAGIVSDRYFGSRRNVPALIFGILYAAALSVFLLVPAGNMVMDVVSISVFGFALGGLMCFFGGLMAVDICSKRAAGAAMGFIGLFSYLAAAAQDYVSGYFIEAGKTVVNGEPIYDFHVVTVLWISAAVLSLFFGLMVWKAKYKE
jgi:OPA family sugar phosphate sensor protein UhpC-like MFS transporter